jgi:LacI family transcriptional regulator
VARLARTSTAVVSYVVNNGPRPVSADARARVLQAIEELDYRPNGMARALRSQRTRTLGLVLPNANNAYFREFSIALEAAALERGYAILVMHLTDDDDRDRRYLGVLLEHGIDGLLAMVEPNNPHADLLLSANCTVNLTDSADRDISNDPASYAATKHLLDHHHRTVAYLSGPLSLTLARERKRGWERALDDHGVAADGRVTVDADFTREAGHRAAHELLANHPTAVLAFNDEQAIGVLRAAADLGLRVPEDVSVFGFDDTRDARYTVPSISTVRTPLDLVANRALDRLLGSDNRPRPSPLPFELVLRRSCGCPEPGSV